MGKTIWMAFLVWEVVLALGFITVYAQTGDDTENVTCQDGWEKVHRACFKFAPDGKSWNEALEFCKQSHGELTSIQSVKEKDELEKHILTRYPDTDKWWVGFKREGQSGSNWNWLANLPVDSGVTPWISEMLQTRPGNVCGMVDMSDKKLQISVTRCTTEQRFICEFNRVTARPSVTSTSPTPAVDTSTTATSMSTTSTSTARTTTASTTTRLTNQPQTSASEIIKTRANVPDGGATITYSLFSSTTIWTTTPTNKEETKKGSARSTTSMSTQSTSLVDGTGKNDITTPASETGSLTSSRKMEQTYSSVSTTPEEERSSTPSPTEPGWTLALPGPTMIDWKKAFEEYRGCYIPSTGSRLRDTVMAARSFYEKGENSCPPLQIGNIHWPSVMAGETAKFNCSNGNGVAAFQCGDNPVCWKGQPDITDCASKKLKSIFDKVEQGQSVTAEPPTAEQSIEWSSKLVEATKAEDISVEDVIVTSQVIEALVQTEPGSVNETGQVKAIVNNVVETGSNLVSANRTALWEEMTPEDQVRSASSLLVAMETATVSLAEKIQEPTVIINKNKDIGKNRQATLYEDGLTRPKSSGDRAFNEQRKHLQAVLQLRLSREVELRVVRVEDLVQQEKRELVYASSDLDNSFSIPVENLKSFSKGPLAKAVFMTHYSMADILAGKRSTGKRRGPIPKATSKPITTDNVNQEEKDKEHQLVSYILSASLGVDGPIGKLPKPITFTMKHVAEIDVKKYRPLCSFWNVSLDGQLGFWSQEGCYVKQGNASHTTCECDHMTNFAILLDVHGMEMPKIHQSLLSLITIIGCVISCVSLLASWVTFQCVQSLQGERNSIHKNLAFTLLVAEILFVFGIYQTQHPIMCSIIAGFLHFFFLSAFTWMFLEGLHIIFMLVQVFDSSRSRLPYYYLTGYGAPLTVVGASCLFFYKGYGTDNYCWLTTDRYFIWAFAGPVALILLVNAIFLTYAMSAVCRHSDYVFSTREKTPASGIRAWIQGALALEVLLGLTWTLGYFLINEDSLPLAYIFAILNSLQGLFIFIFHCLLSKKAQKEYRRVARTMVKRSPSTATQSTYTKRTNHTNQSNHSHEMNHSHSPTNSHQKLNAANSHSTA